MYIIEVIPLTLLPPHISQILSYFFDKELPKGAVVEISLNNRKVKAVVISSNSLEKKKLSLKKVDFQIKKLVRVIYEKPQVSDYQLKLAAWIARYYYAPLGYTLKTLFPSFAFKNKFPVTPPTQLIHSTTRRIVPSRLLIYKTKGLAKHLESSIKEAVRRPLDSARGKQVLIVVPEKSSISYFYKYFSKKYNTAAIYSGLSNEKLYNVWSRLTSHESATSQSPALGFALARPGRILDSQNESRQKARSDEVDVIVGTRQALNIPFKNLGLIIVDDPLHEFYKSDMVPRYNAVNLAYKVAELNNARLVLASVVPGVENHYKFGTRDKGQGTSIKNLEPRPKFDFEIIDMAQEVKNANWSPISKKLNEELFAYLRNNKRILIFSPRRGYAGVLICGNCGSAVKCPQCEVAMRTHRSVEFVLVCHHCGISKPIPRNCSVCGNHNLKAVGPAGTQKIYDIIKMTLNAVGIKSPVLALDTDIVQNEVEEEEIINEVSKSGPSVLIATQMIFSHRFYLNFDLIAVINADALTNIPDFRSEENLFYQMEKLINFEPSRILIQTYNPENKLFERVAEGDYNDFYDRELKLRKVLNYPPFYKLIKLTFRHKDREKASYAARVATEKLKMAIGRAKLGEEIKIIEATPAYIERERGLYVYNIFLKVREGYQDINELLKYAGPGWIIDVEPRSLL